MTHSVAGVYITGLYGKSGQLVSTTKALLASKMNDYIFWSVHVHPDASLWYNNSPLASEGTVNPDIGQPIADLIGAARKAGLVESVWFSIGAGGVSDFANIQSILAQGGALESGLYANLAAVMALGADGFDFDYEENVSNPVDLISQFGVGLNQRLNARLTYCPYYGQAFWIDCLKATYAALGTQPVEAFNLQCYSGGAGQDPRQWAQAIERTGSETGVSDPTSFVRPGMATAGGPSGPALAPYQMASQILTWGTPGGWIWNSESVVTAQGTTGYSMADYAKALLTPKAARKPETAN